MLKRLRLRLRIRRLRRYGEDAGLRLLDVEARMRELHPESLERELLYREADLLERVILANGHDLKDALDELETL